MAFGQLDRGGNAQPMSEINITPLVDVMLVLLVVFIITAPLLTHKIKLDLPNASAQVTVSQQPVTVSLTDDGQLFIDREAITPEQLTERLTAWAARTSSPSVELRADASVMYERVVQVLQRIQSAGISKFAFVTEPVGHNK